MRLIHTADWHLGRRLKGLDRTPEIAFALNELITQIKTLDIDAVLVAGDIFDMPNPPAEAEKVAYHFFCQLHELQIPAVVITGNHDSPARFEGIANLLSHVGVQTLARPQLSKQGGIISVNTKNGKLCVAAVPFASERRLLKIEDFMGDLEQRQHYKGIIIQLLNELTQAFQADAVNIILAHLTVEGAIRAYSEIDYYTRDTYELSRQIFPSEAQYVALGHIHKPQALSGAVPTFYAGSLIQVDFGEAEEKKGFNLVTVTPNRPATVEFKPIPCQKPLLKVETDSTLENLALYREHHGFLKVIVKLESPQIGLANKVRKICPQALIVETQYATIAEETTTQPTQQFDAIETFQRYWLERVKTSLPPNVLETFTALYEELRDASD